MKINFMEKENRNETMKYNLIKIEILGSSWSMPVKRLEQLLLHLVPE